MLFDEKKRGELIKAYRALPVIERQVLRLLSVAYFPVNVDSLKAVARATHFSELGGLAADKVKKMLARWKKLGLAVSEKRDYSDVFWAVSPLLREPTAREAVRNDEYDVFNRAFLVHAEKFPRTYKLKQPSYSRRGGIEYGSRTAWFRDMRTAFYTGDARLLMSAMEINEVDYYQENDRLVFTGTPNLPPEVAIMCNPIDENLILSLPETIGVEVIARAMDFLEPSGGEIGILERLLRAYFEKHPNNPIMAQFIAEELLSRGRADEAAALVTPDWIETSPEIAPLIGAIMTARGDPDGALTAYEAGLKQLRREYKKKKGVAFRSRFGVFYPILLARAAVAAESEDEANGITKKFSEYVDVESEFQNFSGQRNSFVLLRPLLSPVQQRDYLLSEDNAQKIMAASKPTDGLMFVLTLIWIAPERAKEFSYFIVDYCRTMTERNELLFAAEALSVLREVAPDEAKKLPQLPEPVYPLKNLVSHRPEWRRALDELKKIADAEAGRISPEAKPERSARVAWEISWQTDNDKKARGIEITPLEQKLQAKGWSKGRKIALERLLRKTDSVAGASESDKKVLPAIKATQSYRYYSSSTVYELDTVPALKALAGHPCLVDSCGGRVEIILDEPQIHTGVDGDSFVFEIRPKPDDGDLSRRAAIYEDGPGVLRLTPFGERHAQISKILGANGLRVPTSARDDVLRVIGGLASITTVHSDIEGAEAGAKTIEADPGLYVQIQPRDDSLDIEAVTRPLGPKSAPCRPGVGETNIFGLSDGVRVRTVRDLDAEASALRGFEDCCPVLARASEASANKWQTTDAEISFEFLTQLQDIADHVTIEWPSGGRRTVKRLAPAAVSISAAALGERDWFEVTGEARVDEGLVLSLKELVKLMDGSTGRFVKIGEGSFIALANDFKRRLDELRSLGDIRGDGIRVHPSAIPLISKLSDEVGDFEADDAWRAGASKIDEAAALAPQIPSTFKGELRDYQLAGFEWISRLAHWAPGACLADDMGLGKTIQALAILVSRASRGPSLVVAPTSVCPNWVDEAARFAPTLAMKDLRPGDRRETVDSLGPLDVLVASYGLLQSEASLLEGVHWNVVVLDEAQSIKNMATKRSAAAMKLDADFKLITTGTPIENNLSELWNLFRFIVPRYLGSHESFNRRFASAIVREDDAEARRRLRRVISPFILRRTKEQVLTELPPKTEVTLRVELHPEERTLYEALRRNAVDEIEAGRTDGGDVRFTILAQLTKLRLACCNSALALPESSGAYRSAKLDAFAEIVSDLRGGGHKALVFSQFVSHLSILKNYLVDNDIPFQYLDGSTTPAERKKRVMDFQNGEGDVFLISLKAGGTGLNLTAADYVVHMDPWWNPAVETQASDRTHRIGQDRPVTIYRIVAKDTIEEKITDLHGWKRELAESLLEGASVPAKFSTGELMELIRGE